jgi:hypothetical protein
MTWRITGPKTKSCYHIRPSEIELQPQVEKGRIPEINNYINNHLEKASQN